MKAFDLKTKLKRQHWERIRTRGSHHRFRNTITGEEQTISYHSETEEIDPVTLRKIEKELNVTLLGRNH
ncbi:MAG: type II toxin-antitoxin system HicA family toxin [Thermoguttaceae bacterium]|nr:type II toxin-antitoxin system HicA family toxin [Thermoguttaceae bacterium]